MNRGQQEMKATLLKDIRIDVSFKYLDFLKKGYRIIQKLTVTQEGMSSFKKWEMKMKGFKIFKKIKTIKRLDIAQFSISDADFSFATSLYIAKRMSSVSCLKVCDYKQWNEDFPKLVIFWPKYMKHLKSFSSMPGEAFGSLEKSKSSPDYLKYLSRLEMVEVNFPSDDPPSHKEDEFWKFQKYPASIKKICFNGTKYLTKPMNISIAHLKNLRDLRFEFGYQYYNSIETIQSVVDLLPQVTQLQALHIDFVANFVIHSSICTALKALKKARFSISCEHRKENLKILKCVENCPLEDLDFRILISCFEAEDLIILSEISEFLSKKKNLKTLKLKITNRYAFEDLKYIQDLLKTVDKLPKLTSFSILTAVDSGDRRGYSRNYTLILPEIDLSFGKLFSRSIPLKKFKISLHQHSFSRKGFMKLLRGLKKFSSTLEKIRIDVGEYKPKSRAETDFIIEFIKNMKNIQSLKLYSLDISVKAFFGELSEAIQGLKFLRVFCLGEFSIKMARPLFVDYVKKILLKRGLEKFHCEIPLSFEKFLQEGDVENRIDILQVRKKNPYLIRKGLPDAPIFTSAGRFESTCFDY